LGGTRERKKGERVKTVRDEGKQLPRKKARGEERKGATTLC